MKPCCFPGLASNARLFRGLSCLRDSHYVVWTDYDLSLSQDQICLDIIKRHKLDSQSILVASSFGSLFALEIASRIQVKKVILISGFIGKQEVSLLLRGLLFLSAYIPRFFFNPRIWPKPLIKYLFSLKNNSETHEFTAMLRSHSAQLVANSIAQVRNWKGSSIKVSLRIHGLQDRIIHAFNSDRHFSGGHILTLSKNQGLDSLIANELDVS